MSILGDVAKAIWDEEHNGCECQARAVFKAIESHGFRIVPIEPTDAMLVAMVGTHNVYDCGNARAVWQAAIDTALKEGQ